MAGDGSASDDVAAGARRRARGGRGAVGSGTGSAEVVERAERADGAGLGARSVDGHGADSDESGSAGRKANGTSFGDMRGADGGRETAADDEAGDDPLRPTFATAAAISVESAALRFGFFVLAGRGCGSGLRCLPRLAGEVSVNSA